MRQTVPDCFHFCGFPNVRKANDPEEVNALDLQYSEAKKSATAGNRGALFDAYEAFLGASVAVVCRSLDLTKALLSSENVVYATYYQETEGAGRLSEDSLFDSTRAATDARVFPRYYKDIRFGALSLDGKGVPTYGACSMVLKSSAISLRTTVFWENTVDFCNRICPIQKEPVPPGYRAFWSTRARLAAAKGQPMLDRQSTVQEFAGILIDRDVFVEVNIYGPFNRNSVERILVAKPTDKADRAVLSAIRDVIKKDALGIAVEEY